MPRLRNKKYIFDIYNLAPTGSDLFCNTAEEFFDKVMTGEFISENTSYGCTRDIFGLTFRKESNSYAGQLRKIRKADLPEIGEPGRDSTRITLKEKEGVVEKNFFVYYKENSLLIMHRNDSGSNGSHLAQLITAISGAAFLSTPLIQPEQAEKILNNKASIKKLSVRIPKPTNPVLYPQDDISGKTISLLNQSGADHLDITFSIDPQLSRQGGLSDALQSAIRPFLSIGATKAVIDTDENGMIHPIDLIANRIYSIQNVRTNASFPPSESMYKLADQSKAEKKEAIDAYFGNPKNRII